VTLVTPYWPSAIWFPTVQALALHPPITLGPQHIQCMTPTTPFPLLPHWKLSVWTLCAQNMETRSYLPLPSPH
jgi:hypothetical protein